MWGQSTIRITYLTLSIPSLNGIVQHWQTPLPWFELYIPGSVRPSIINSINSVVVCLTKNRINNIPGPSQYVGRILHNNLCTLPMYSSIHLLPYNLHLPVLLMEG